MRLGGIELAGVFGGYEIVNQPANSLPQDVASAIGTINSGLLGATYQPIWYVGKQVVNGINHFFIAEEIRTTKKQSKEIVGLVINIPPGDFTGENAKVVEIIEEAELPDEVQDAFEATVHQLTGVNYKPMMYIGKQVVHGINYFILCAAKVVHPDAVARPVVITINVVDGNKYSIVSIEGIDAMNALGYAFTW